MRPVCCPRVAGTLIVIVLDIIISLFFAQSSPCMIPCMILWLIALSCLCVLSTGAFGLPALSCFLLACFFLLRHSHPRIT